MKKTIISLILVAATWGTHAQSAADVFKASEIIWFGLDFSEIKLKGQFTQIGTAGFKNESEIRDIYFEAWNNIIIYQPEKYDLVKTFQTGNVPYEMDMISKRNANTNVDNIFSGSSENTVDAERVKKMVTTYKTKKDKGIGCVFIMESFDKGAEAGAMWVTFFDIGSKKVLFTERMTGKAGGFGLKNYWIRTVYEVLIKIQRSQFKAWKNKYSK